MTKIKDLSAKLDHYKELINAAKMCMMITEEKDEKYLCGRPMTISKVDDDGAIWFFTKETWYWTDEMEDDKIITLTFLNDEDNTYLMVHGKATLSEDSKKMKKLWSSEVEGLFPEGLEESNLILIKIQPEEIHNWDDKENRMILFLDFSKMDN
jgi:general stress protein 26